MKETSFEQADFTTLQEQLTFAFTEFSENQEKVMTIDEVDIEEGEAIGRSVWDAPDIDGRVYIKTPARKDVLPTGQFAKVKIVGHTDYDLIAEPV